jgi:hypothetical protein
MKNIFSTKPLAPQGGNDAGIALDDGAARAVIDAVLP